MYTESVKKRKQDYLRPDAEIYLYPAPPRDVLTASNDSDTIEDIWNI